MEFRRAAALSPKRTDIRKNLAYTLLKTGDTDEAREEFGVAARLDPADFHVALEYAFLCYEAREEAPTRKAEARRIFARVRDTAPDAGLRATAGQAFRNVDEPLAQGIARWQTALATSAPNFSAHFELAQLAEQRDELELAAANYRAAFKLLPTRKSVLLELARVEDARGNLGEAFTAWLAASRGGEPRAAELARERMPQRYPFVYEFRKAVELDPSNVKLQRELAYLLLAMSEKGQAPREEAKAQFREMVKAAPNDYLAVAQLGLLYLADGDEAGAKPLLDRVLRSGDAATSNRVRRALKMPLILEDRSGQAAALDPRILGERSYEAGFMKDALRYFTQAHEANPVDSAVTLKLGWTANMLHDDGAAVRWFNLARQSADPGVAADAARAWRNLRPATQRVSTTVWVYPLYSSRWSDLFGFGQAKTELRLKGVPVRPYASARFVGDVRRRSGGVLHQALSESAVIMAGGVRTEQRRGLLGWFEAGMAVNYLYGFRWRDLRGGVSYSRTVGAGLLGERSGAFSETTADSVFISRFHNNLISYAQNKTGYTTRLGTMPTQFFWAANLTFDARRQAWANFVETGPGLRVHPPGAPPSVAVTLTAMHGVYTQHDASRRPNFNDLRIGVWYAFTR